MLCVVALIVFGALGLFSARYRSLASEAMVCVFRKMTLRPCVTALDARIKAKLLTKLLWAPPLARAINRHFEAFSWLFTLTFFLSLGYSAWGLWNLATLGACEPGAPGCILAPGTGPPSAPECPIKATFIEFIGAECPHCAAMEPIVAQVERETGVVFERLEVWHNSTNRDIMTRFHSQELLRDCGGLYVPAFVSQRTHRAVCGEMSAAALKQWVEQNR